MASLRLLLAFSVCVGMAALTGCRPDDSRQEATAGTKRESADEFIARINDEYQRLYPEITSAQWVSSTYINDDSQRIAAKANARHLARFNTWIAQARPHERQKMQPETARAIALLKRSPAMPAPRDPAKLAELTYIATRLEGAYGQGAYCTGQDQARTCRELGQLEEVLRTSRDYGQQLDAWQGWHSVAMPMRPTYTRLVELVSEGARDMGYADTGELWRSNYDMPPSEIGPEIDRLWNQVKPLYEQLHCYTRTKLVARYGARGQVDGLLPAHLMGNMWQQDWRNVWDLLQPYPGIDDLDISTTLRARSETEYAQLLSAANLDTQDPFESARDRAYATQLRQLGHPASSDERQRLSRQAYDVAIAQIAELRQRANLATAKSMVAQAQDFYTSLDMPRLPESYWLKSQFIKPRDRNVVCHASAWDMDMQGDVRTKMCITASAEDFTTIYHELGHLYYDLAYHQQPALFQSGANDGFHEAIGDTITLAMTPDYLRSIGLVEGEILGEAAIVNAQMRMALSKVSFLPFGLVVDRWRWGVFDGSIKPEHYNRAWWQLKAQYQGVAPASSRGEAFFDPGAKYHVSGNTPYLRYFIAHILQFQFYKALCDASGHTGPLSQCSFYGNKVAGQKLWTMLSKGSRQPWQTTLREMTGSDRMDARPLLEYFTPLRVWLEQQNQGQSCGWQANTGTTMH